MPRKNTSRFNRTRQLEGRSQVKLLMIKGYKSFFFTDAWLTVGLIMRKDLICMLICSSGLAGLKEFCCLREWRLHIILKWKLRQKNAFYHVWIVMKHQTCHCRKWTFSWTYINPDTTSLDQPATTHKLVTKKDSRKKLSSWEGTTLSAFPRYP